jgi:hypothetical protein
MVQWWTTHASLRRLAWWWRRTPVMIPLSGRVPGRASGPSRSQVDDGDGLQYVSWKSVRALRVFAMKRIYRRKGDVRGHMGAHTIGRCGQGWGHATPWCGRLLAALGLSFGLRLRVRKIGTLAFVSSNSKNISCVTFLKHKNSRK